jgi:glyoxylase-like metal-dependent hydrolase (beta-lactamase superfamily II)
MKTPRATRKSGNHAAGGLRRHYPDPGGVGPSVGDLGGTERTSKGTIRIRMYRVGFGDCFLVSLPAQGGDGAHGTYHVLVDCGVHAKGNIGKIGQVVDDIATATGGKLAVVIATHAHQDHISGFGDKFSSFDIGEVWLPWTWDPNNPQAVQLQKRQAALVAQLALCSDAMAGDPSALNAVLNMTGNEHAISLLKSGFGVNAKVRYLKAGDKLTAGDVAKDPSAISVPGLSVSILGPPQSEEFLAKMDSPPGEHYLQLSFGMVEAVESDKPFSEKWVLSKEDPELSSVKLTPEHEKELQDKVKSPLSALAFAIDQARNNESIVALLTFRGQYLLFPGDAEYGNWRWWLDNLQPEETLPQVTFFKVAHHGSVNATPVDALEKMSQGKFAAMVSTQSTPWPSIPCVPLMARLNTKTQQRVVRSDWLKLEGAPDPSPRAEPPLPPELPAGFVKGDFWIDYSIML